MSKDDFVRKIENTSFKIANNVLFCSSSDRDLFLKSTPSLLDKGFVLPNGIDVKKYAFTKEQREKARELFNFSDDQNVFLFSGSLYGPNVEAFNFLKTWADLFRDELLFNKVIIFVAGSVEREAFCSECIKVIGKVDDILPCFAASDFGINPIISGSGTNIKMFEYIASGMPILTTEFGKRGLSLEDKISCLIFDRENLFLKIKEAISKSPDSCRELSNNAFVNNQSVLDMHQSLSSLNINW